MTTPQLREMLTDAAESRTSDDLAARAITSAKRRRRTRAVVVGSVAAAAALVLGSVVTGTLVRSSDEPQPTDVMSLPDVMPSPADLPSLADAPMSTAAAAYVNDNMLVLVNSQTQKAATWDGFPAGEYDVPDAPPGGALRPYGVSLSPDGHSALVAMQYASSSHLLGLPMALLDISTGNAQLLNGLRMADATPSGWRSPNFMAWSANSDTGYCVCLGPQQDHINLWTVNAPVSGSTSPKVSLVPGGPIQSQISVGTGGYAMQIGGDGQWEPGGIGADGTWQMWDSPALPRADAIAVGVNPDQPGAYTFIAVDSDQYSVGELGHKEYPWDVWAPLPGGGPVASVSAAPAGFIAVTWPKDAKPGDPPPPVPLEVWYFDAEGANVQLSTLPAGTGSASFAVVPLT